MSENKPIQLLYTYRLKWRDLAHLSEVEQAALTAVFFCDNEVSSLRRLSLLSMFWLERSPAIQRAADIQRNMLLRTLTGRLFEFLALYNEISSRGRESKKLRNAMMHLKEDRRKCEAHGGYKIAKKIRNSHAHHYSLAAVEALVKKQAEAAVFDLYLSPELTNAYAPFAEDLVFNPDPAGRLEEELERGEADEILGNWIEWTHIATDLLRKLRDRLFEDLILSPHPQLRPQFRTEFLQPDLKVEETFRLPLFIQGKR